MKTEFTDVSETRKHVTFEVEPDVVAAEIARVATGYTQIRARARVSSGQGAGDRGPATLQGSDSARRCARPDSARRRRGAARARARTCRRAGHQGCRARGGPAADVRRGLRDDAASSTPASTRAITLRKPPAVLEVGAVDQALDHLQERHARWHPVEDRPAGRRRHDPGGLDADAPRQARDAGRRSRAAVARRQGRQAGGAAERDDRDRRAGKPSRLRRAADGRVRRRRRESSRSTTRPTTRSPELAGATVDYVVNVKGIRRKELLPLDDEFAKEVSDVETLEALRDRDPRGSAARRRAGRRARMRHELAQGAVVAHEGRARRAGRAGDRSPAGGVRPPADGTGHRSR